MDLKENQRPEENDKEKPQQKSHFQVKYIPKGLFQLFKKNDPYLYEKKFSCDLPKNIIPPKSFHYPFSLENFCQSDLLTMDFDLNKNLEILTDSKINTLIHQDFINNTLEIAFPSLTTLTKKKTEAEQDFKKKIIKIIEKNDESNQDINPILNEIPDFLRRQTYLRPTTEVNLDKRTKDNDKIKNEKKQRTSLTDLKNSIDQSFIDIDKIKEGMKHPDEKQKGVTAKKVYEISPMDDMPNVNFVEYLFPTDPSKVIELDEKYMQPQKFLIKSNQNNNISDETTCSCYINNKLKTQEDHKDKDQSEYYTYATDFTTTKINENDLFNRYFLILDKVNKKLKMSRLKDKFILRRNKRVLLEEYTYEDEEDQTKKIGYKRKRDIITAPQSMQKEEFDKKKKWITEKGYNTKLIERKIEAVDHSDVIEIQRERELELEEENKRKNKNVKEKENENENMDEEDIEKDYEDNAEENENYEQDNNEENDNDNDNNEKNKDIFDEFGYDEESEGKGGNEGDNQNENENNDDNENNENEENEDKEEKEEKEEIQENEEKEEKDENEQEEKNDENDDNDDEENEKEIFG